MSNLKKFFILLVAILVLVGIGLIAKGYNESHHMEMALDECGSEENIAKVDSKGFECKKEE